MDEEKMFLELQFKQLRERNNMHTGIEEREKVIFEDSGYNE